MNLKAGQPLTLSHENQKADLTARKLDVWLHRPATRTQGFGQRHQPQDDRRKLGFETGRRLVAPACARVK